MVLNQIRNRIQPVMDSIGRALANSGITPDILTILGFILALIAGVWFALKPSEQFISALLILSSGVMDMLDGVVARAKNKVSALGSFHDSTLDRISETVIYAGIVYGGYAISPVFVLLAATVSLLVSYVRAKGESLSIKMSGIGIGERAERLIILIIFAAIGYVNIGIYIVLILAVITFGQRYKYIVGKLKNAKRA